VSHGNIRVNGKKVDRPGYLAESGDAVSVAPKARDRAQLMADVERGPQLRLPSYLALDPASKFEGRVIGSPMKGDVPFPVNGSALVEFYAR
jgi:small subunit ribosomal protein S4